MTETKARKDSENLAKLESLRPVYDRLKEDKIRNDSDVERYASEYEAARLAAEAEFGTSDLAEIRQRIEDTRLANTRSVDEFEASLSEVKAAVAALDRT